MHRREFLQQTAWGGAGLAVGAGCTSRMASGLRTSTTHGGAAPHMAERMADRMAWWREARFGMFLHFGMYSTLGGEWKGNATGSHEWIRNNAKIPHDEYIALVRQFNPTGFDGDAWVRAAKDAGQKYIVLTTKHHDGFSLFDSRATTYDVMSTPFQRDIMREVANACRQHDMRLGWYYSIMDWYHPDYLPRRDWEIRDATGADFARYLQFMQAQLHELLTQYGDISVLWFDGQWEATWTHAAATALSDYCRAIAPNIIINDRIDVGVPKSAAADPSYVKLGDYTTPELKVPDVGLPGVEWETCMTMNENWGYSKFDHNFKSVPTLVRLLVETASKGGNLLLNVGPMGDGRFPQESIDGLRGVGAWMRVNSGAIYGSSGTPFVDAPYVDTLPLRAPVRVTAQAKRLNLFVDEWREGTLMLPSLKTVPTRAYVLGDPAVRLAVSASTAGVAVTLPDRGPGTLVPVIALDFSEPPRIVDSD